VEETLEQVFSQSSFAEVDDHDIDQGSFSIFTYPAGTWGPVLERVYACAIASYAHFAANVRVVGPSSS